MNTKTNKPTCTTCRFFHSGPNLCRYNPPVVLYASADDSTPTIWPKVHNNDWCGKHDLA